ncbi:MAPK regulated corepressor interacting protein 2 [Hyalella azteca]|uniref:MAPK regulated corepressor interacting protein 2 n=1 Tax=Hyalella azteca TaxID=294128 RepID=A0A8B7P6K2_HYAAZ|nr:MAPK regulated corepressor interacting protein 2 [Hyalella azteca]
MYTVSGGPTRIINRTRRDIPLKLENLEVNRDLRRKNSGDSDDSEQSVMSSPRLVFQPATSGKGSRNGNNRHNSNSNSQQEASPPLSPSHMEIVNFFSSSWAEFQQELDADQSRQNGHDDRGKNRITVYECKEVHPIMEGFKPLNFEEWWAKRLYTKITKA